MPTIAIIDDSNYMRLLLEESLRQEGYGDIQLFETAGAFFNWLEEDGGKKELDLLLLDWMLSETDGLEVIKNIKEDFGFPNLPVLMVTARTDPEDLKQAFEAGCMDYVKKPLEEVELQARVKSALRLKKALDKQREQLRELEKLVRTDGLTGLANKREFTRVLEREWKRSHRYGKNLSLVMVDVDYFKLYNDTYGHEAGDEVLEKVAGALEKILRRPADCAARYGGEEFALILPETDIEGAKNVAERAKTAVEELDIDHEARPEPRLLTVSLGVCSNKLEAVTSPSDLVKMADRALYEAKENGRNQVCVQEE